MTWVWTVFRSGKPSSGAAVWHWVGNARRKAGSSRQPCRQCLLAEPSPSLPAAQAAVRAPDACAILAWARCWLRAEVVLGGWATLPSVGRCGWGRKGVPQEPAVQQKWLSRAVLRAGPAALPGCCLRAPCLTPYSSRPEVTLQWQCTLAWQTMNVLFPLALQCSDCI